MSYSKIKSYAKINLALNVVGKSKSLHRIESIVSFLDLHDEIKIKKIKYKNHKIRFLGKFSNGLKKYYKWIKNKKKPPYIKAINW